MKLHIQHLKTGYITHAYIDRFILDHALFKKKSGTGITVPYSHVSKKKTLVDSMLTLSIKKCIASNPLLI